MNWAVTGLRAVEGHEVLGWLRADRDARGEDGAVPEEALEALR